MTNIKHIQDCGVSRCFARRPAAGRPGAFTLVELLVVIVIISMLVGLLLPAVMRSRATARKVECANNQRQLAQAIINFETSKKRLPGFVNQVNGSPVSWVPVLFPFLGRMDLWEGANGWRQGGTTVGNTPPMPHIEQLVCPDEAQFPETPQLSYVVNCGLYKVPANVHPTDPAAMSAPGVFRAGSSQTFSLSDIKSPTQTIMLSEKHTPTKVWSTETPTFCVDVIGSCVGFLWPDTTDPSNLSVYPTVIGQAMVSTDGGPTLYPPLPAVHPGVVIVTFCDGHQKEISEDAPCHLYRATP
ncbi:MAG: DUF1559 domain-containing protein [Pirellulaceae bacterium]|nr:DUF1559 domain-containing protein [Pirellulaceae bacterium]